MSTGESKEERLNRELIEFLNELRVALPGVQVLFAFLLIVPFSQRYEALTDLQKDVYFVTFLCTAAATAFLIAPVRPAPAALARSRQGTPARHRQPAGDRRHGTTRARDLRHGLPRDGRPLRADERGRRHRFHGRAVRLALVRLAAAPRSPRLAATSPVPECPAYGAGSRPRLRLAPSSPSSPGP